MTVNGFTPRPGDLVLCQITGLIGFIIRLGQGLLAGDWSPYTHVAVVLPGGKVIGAQPGGARIDPIETVYRSKRLAFLPVPDAAEHLRDDIADYAEALKDTPYGFASYAWIGLSRVPFLPRPEWLRRLVASSATLICSAMGDFIWRRFGLILFRDQRLIGEVTPGDISHTNGVIHMVRRDGAWHVAGPHLHPDVVTDPFALPFDR